MNAQTPPAARIKPYSDFSFKEGEVAVYVNREERELGPVKKRVRTGKEDFVVQSLSRVQLFVTPWTAARQASLSSTISQSLL